MSSSHGARRCLSPGTTLSLLLAGVVSCSTSDSSPPMDTSPAPDGTVVQPDQGAGDVVGADSVQPDVPAVADTTPPPPDQAPPAADTSAPLVEQEPNDGSTVSEFNAISVPAQLAGTIGQAGDTDIFRFAAAAGDRIAITLQSTGELQPHLAVFGEAPLDVPPVVSRGSAGGTTLLELYVLESGNYFLGVRDRRNVDGNAGVGGAPFGYTVAVAPLTRAPTPLAMGGEVSATLDPPGTVAVLSFDAQQDDDLTLEVFAARLGPPSDVDTRLSLFHVGQKQWLGTNDNPSLLQTDSTLNGKMPFAGTYHAIVENVTDSGTDLRFTIKLSKN